MTAYVIVGASVAGATAAITLREEGVDGAVTLIGAEHEPPYERPPLSKAYLRGDVPFDKALVRPPAFYVEHGIETMFGIRATRIDPSARFVELECDFAVIGIGIEPAVEMLGGSGIHVDNGVVVDEYCQTNVSGIYAAGDIANHYHPVFVRHIRVEHWQNAVKQGAAAARNMPGKRIAYDEIHWFWSDQYDVNLQYAGFHTKWEQLVVRGRLDSGSYLACYVNDGRIDAAVGLNRGKDVRRVMPLIKARRVLNLDQLRDESVDLRALPASP